LKSRRRANRTLFDQWAPKWCTLTSGEVIDYEEIKRHIDGLGKRFHLVEATADKWNATALANSLQAEGLPMIGFAQNFSTLSPATKDFEALVLSGKIRIKKNPLFSWAFSNVVIIRNSNDDQRPDKSKSGDKIDPVVSALMALARCRLATAGGESTYESEGMTVI
jgi:phage terminase large subunit-like protein